MAIVNGLIITDSGCGYFMSLQKFFYFLEVLSLICHI